MEVVIDPDIVVGSVGVTTSPSPANSSRSILTESKLRFPCERSVSIMRTVTVPEGEPMENVASTGACWLTTANGSQVEPVSVYLVTKPLSASPASLAEATTRSV